MSARSIVDLFSGAGGCLHGAELAGFRALLATDIDKNCCDTIKNNYPTVPVEHKSVTEINFSEYEELNVDVVCGGIPCQPYSTAGLRQGLEDPRGNLFFEFARAIDEIRPKSFVMENVKGLKNYDGGKVLEFMIEHLESKGYTVYNQVLNAYNYNVPQKRERLFVVGFRNNILPTGIDDFEFPEHSTVKNVLRTVLGNITEPGPCAKYSDTVQEVMEQVPEGGNWRNLPRNIQIQYLGGSFNSRGGNSGIARRLSMNKPAPTLVCSPTQKTTSLCHPTETRPLSILEYKLIQTFPQNYKLVGSKNAMYKMIGNAIPPRLAKALLRQIKRYLNKCESN